MNNNTATIGDAKLYQRIKGFEVRATLGNSSAGYGWRPVCGGVFIGNECFASEKAAVTKGKIYVNDLRRRVDSFAHVPQQVQQQAVSVTPKKLPRSRKAVAK